VIEYLMFGGGFAFAAAVQPGPLQAFLLSRVASIGWRRTLPATLAPAISDGPIALLVLLLLKRMPPGLEQVLKIVGGLVLLYFAFMAFRQWRHGSADMTEDKASVPRTVMQAVVVNILNPAPYLGWSLVLGPMAVEAWQQTPAYAVGLIGAFYITMVTTMVVFIILLGTTDLLGPASRRLLLLISAAALAALGLMRLISALM
jgi:threonine/homoserine/homoserine lactone efflux protein